MNRISIRTIYHGAAVVCYSKTGWAHWPANSIGEAGEFHADDGTQTACKAQDVTVWLGEAAIAT